MELDIAMALVGGLVATGVMTLVMIMAPQMGMPKMDMPGLLGSMFGAPGNRLMGLGMHFMMGAIFGVIYAVLFDAISDADIVTLGVIFGIVHWFIAGAMTGMMPMMHAGIKSGDVPAPGIFMTNIGGMMGFVGGMMGHIVFGLVFALVYQALAG